MLPDVAKSAKTINEFLNAIGLRVGPRFAPVAASVAITLAVAATGLALLEDVKGRLGKLETGRTELQEGQLAQAELIAALSKKLNESVDTRLDTLAASITRLQAGQASQSDFIQTIARKINETADGFWIPVSMEMESPASGVSLKLPILSRDRVELAIYYEDSNADRTRIIKDNILISFNGEVLKPTSRYMGTDVPMKVEGALIREEKIYQQIEVGLANTLSMESFEKIRGRQVGLLIVVKRAVLAPRTQEDVPAIGSTS
jgi:hypothetical protein